MKQIKSIILTTVSASLLLTSCTEGYEAMNMNPGGVTKKEMERDGYSLRSAMLNLENWAMPTDVNTCQLIDCLGGGTWGGYLSDSNSGFNGKNFSTFCTDEGWNSSLFKDIIPPMFLYTGKVAEATNDPVPNAVAKIIKVFGLQRVTDAFGPIPYTHVGKEGKLNAPYDDQKTVYYAMFDELNAAIKTLTERQTANFNGKADHIFGGNVVKWVRFANSLKLRMALRIVNVDPDKAKQEGESAVTGLGVMKGNDDTAQMTPAGKNPFYVVMHEYNGGDSRVNANITTFMNGYDDPRRSAMFTKTTFADKDNAYNGLRSGIIIPGADIAHAYSNYNVTMTTPLLWMNAAEVAFLKAEAVLRGWNMGGGTAEQFYNEGIRLSFDQWKVAGADKYLANDTRTPAAYIDPAGDNGFSNAPSNITIKWDSNASFDTNLERIITQKWIANFPLGHEAWSEYRRTGFPRLMPAMVDKSGGIVDLSRGARRQTFTQAERSDNHDNYLKAVEMLGGPDNLSTDVWWAAKKK